MSFYWLQYFLIYLSPFNLYYLEILVSSIYRHKFIIRFYLCEIFYFKLKNNKIIKNEGSLLTYLRIKRIILFIINNDVL